MQCGANRQCNQAAFDCVWYSESDIGPDDERAKGRKTLNSQSLEDQMAESSKPAKPKASADKLIKPTKKGDIELTEEDLKKVSGGMAIKVSDKY